MKSEDAMTQLSKNKSLVLLSILCSLFLTLIGCEGARPIPSTDDDGLPSDELPSDDGLPNEELPSDSVLGDIVKSDPHRFSLNSLTKAADDSVQSWKITYLSESALGDMIKVSGTVIVPKKPWSGPGERPLVTWGVGTRGIGDKCPPSYSMSIGKDYEGSSYKNALNRGWALAITDYEGLGTPGKHTYIVGQSEGRAVLNIARAALKHPEAGLGKNTPIGIFGYSQGGGAAAWAAQLAPKYAPELNIKGVAAGGIPSDLAAIADFTDKRLVMAFTLMASVGLDAAYPELNLDSYLNEAGKKLFKQMGEVCIMNIDGLDELMGAISIKFKSRHDFTTKDPLASPAWKKRLEENRLGKTAPKVPIFQYHGKLDEIVPFKQAEDLRQNWCNLGANVTWKALGGEHFLSMITGLSPALDFLGDRFAGKQATGNCTSGGPTTPEPEPDPDPPSHPGPE